jgi:hypothetical protein
MAAGRWRVTNEEGSACGYDSRRRIGLRSEVKKQKQRRYLALFAACRRVVDLSCGDGGFAELRGKRGIEGPGVDAAPVACATARENGTRLVCEDVFGYLEGMSPGSCTASSPRTWSTISIMSGSFGCSSRLCGRFVQAEPRL